MSHQEVPQPILFVIDHFRNPNAGTEGQMLNLIKGLDRARFEPILLVFRDSEYLRKYGFPCDYHVLGHTRLFAPVTWAALWKLAWKFRASEIRLAHVFFNDPSVICPPIFRLNGIKTIISRRDMGYWYTLAYRVMLAISGRFVSTVITNSDAVKQVTIRAEPFDLSQVHVIYNGYGAGETFCEVPADLTELRTKHLNAVFVGLVANIRPVKRMEDAVKAIGQLHQSGHDVHLILIGDGSQANLRLLASEQGVAERVHFLGPRADVKACLKALDIGLLCSESEGFSNAIVEYMQAGLPVVCSNVGGNPEAVEHGETGYLYPCGDVAALASHLRRLSDSGELRQRIGDNAFRCARERFSMETMVAKHQEIYDGLIGPERSG
ncbi:Glycosyltransferase involved in cell wall bisynthesis [Marinobacter sp. es.048]|uniref:glycosyltransferase n=1 Tax=Marinobacter sp. es.048 TaxID=1761795 RepID=UPI000B593EBA|nr:glycosyltransferase [Marinobacter sp. es.048]SNC68267.1 Glycosyltransferase involved in cell wall bisynthesis [Marinobacter sp. es.048]SNC74354.1 Glycosyltransferase involved in cell wall bisynthesis [Marinobacter sp. es.048]